MRVARPDISPAMAQSMLPVRSGTRQPWAFFMGVPQAGKARQCRFFISASLTAGLLDTPTVPCLPMANGVRRFATPTKPRQSRITAGLTTCLRKAKTPRPAKPEKRRLLLDHDPWFYAQVKTGEVELEDALRVAGAGGSTTDDSQATPISKEQK